MIACKHNMTLLRKEHRRRGFSGVFTYRNPLINDAADQPSTPDDGTSFLIRDESPSSEDNTHQNISNQNDRTLRYHPTDEEDPRSRQNSVLLAPPEVSVHTSTMDMGPRAPHVIRPAPRARVRTSALHTHTGTPPTTQATFAQQTRALFLKNGLMQMRSWKTNVSLLSGAVLFPLMLLVLQGVLNNMLDTPDNVVRCGM